MKQPTKSPISFNKGFGIQGATIQLSLMQMTALGNAYSALMERVEDLSEEEKDLVPFLMVFKEFACEPATVWEKFFVPQEEQQEP